MRLTVAAWLFCVYLFGLPLISTASATDCVVRGMVYNTPDVAEVEAKLEAPDFCNLKVIRYERHITILSRYWRVELDIPVTVKGWSRFYYLWGYGVAYFGAQSVGVDYGPAEHG